MSYINKALKDFVNLLKNDYQMREVLKMRAEETGSKKDYWLSVDLVGDSSRVLNIRINHCTETYLHSILSRNGRHYYTQWGKINSKERDAVRYARKRNIPVVAIEIGIYDLTECLWCIDRYNLLAFGYKFFKSDDKYKDVKELIEDLKNKHC